VLVAQTSLGVVDLHAGDPEIREDHVDAGEVLPLQHFVDPGEVAAMAAQRRSALRKPLAGAFQFDAVDVQADQSAGGTDSPEELGRVAAVAERAIDDDLAGGGPQELHDLFDQDGDMRARGRVAFGSQVGLHFGIRLEVVFFVFLRVVPRMGATVARPPSPLL